MAIKGILSLFKKAAKKYDEFYGVPKPKQTEVAESVAKDPDPITKTNLPALSKQEQGLMTLSPGGRAEAEDIRLTNLYKKLQKNAVSKPLSFGGSPNRPFTERIMMNKISNKNFVESEKNFGSALFDVIAGDTSTRKMPGSYWMGLVSKDQGKYIMPGYQNVRKNITKEELADTNLLHFDEKNRPIGGLLLASETAKQPLSKLTLLKQIKRNPANRFFVLKNFMDQSVKQDLTDYQKFFTNYLVNMESSLSKAGVKLTKSETDIIRNTGKTLTDIKFPFQKGLLNSVDQGKRGDDFSVDRMEFRFPAEFGNIFLKHGKKIEAKSPELLKGKEAIEKMQDIMKNKLQASMSRTQARGFNAAGQNLQYRIPGADDYREMIIVQKKLPEGHDVEHGGLGSPTKNTLGHIRYQYNDFLDPQSGKLQGGKIAIVNEIQSDIAAAQAIAREKKVRGVNPMGAPEIRVLTMEAMDDVNKSSKKLFNYTADPANRNKLDVEKLRKETNDNQARLDALQAMRTQAGLIEKDTATFVPFAQGSKRDRENYGDFFLKQLIKEIPAEKENVQWIGIAPTTLTQAAKLEGDIRGMAGARGRLGNWEFYGTPDGKMGIKGVKGVKRIRTADGLEDAKTDTNPNPDSVMMTILKRLAKEYDSEVKLIKVAKSDPNKEFKAIRRIPNWDESLAYNKKATGPSDDSIEILHAGDTAREIRAIDEGAHRVERMLPGDSRNYFTTYALKLTPAMKEARMKIYKKEGGLVVDLFKW
jgi:hypothetical protein